MRTTRFESRAEEAMAVRLFLSVGLVTIMSVRALPHSRSPGRRSSEGGRYVEGRLHRRRPAGRCHVRFVLHVRGDASDGLNVVAARGTKPGGQGCGGETRFCPMPIILWLLGVPLNVVCSLAGSLLTRQGLRAHAPRYLGDKRSCGRRPAPLPSRVTRACRHSLSRPARRPAPPSPAACCARGLGEIDLTRARLLRLHALKRFERRLHAEPFEAGDRREPMSMANFFPQIGVPDPADRFIENSDSGGVTCAELRTISVNAAQPHGSNRPTSVCSAAERVADMQQDDAGDDGVELFRAAIFAQIALA